MVLSTELIFALANEGLMLETSALKSLYEGQLTLSTQLIKPNYLAILPPTQHRSFFRNLPPLFVCCPRQVYVYFVDHVYDAQGIHGQLLINDNTRQDDLFNSAQFDKTHRLTLHRQLNTVQLRNGRTKCNLYFSNKIGSELGSSKYQRLI